MSYVVLKTYSQALKYLYQNIIGTQKNAVKCHSCLLMAGLRVWAKAAQPSVTKNRKSFNDFR